MIAWLRRNLFSSPFNAALTVVALGVLYLALPPLVEWAIIDADWQGETRRDCSREGACWVFVKAGSGSSSSVFTPRMNDGG